jgi:gliding motility-associated-like protein
VNVIEHPNPTPVIIGNLFTCSANPTTLYVDSASIYTNYVWSNTSTNDSVSTVSGLFTVTVTDTNGCVGTSPPITVVNANPLVSISGVQPFCPGDSILLTANPTIPSGANYVWSTTATTQSDQVYTGGDYNVTINYSNGCHAADTFTVTMFNGPNANFTTNPPGSTNLGAPVNFTDISTVSGGTITTWYWDFGDASGSHPSTQNPVHQYGENGTYTITLAVQSLDGCWDTIRKQYEIISEIQVPNVFTPNSSGSAGLNQFFYFKNLEYYPSSKLQVYNRWGVKVYESADYQNNWTGDKHPDGVYYFILNGPKLKEPIVGFVQILR